MAILNLTPDSFSDGGAYGDPTSAAEQGMRLMGQGAQIIDIGAESTRPGARPTGPGEEWARLAPVVGILRNENPDALLSIDTRHPEVARLALDAGADAINDVTGFGDPEMLALASRSKCGLVAVRSRLVSGNFWMPDYSDASPKNAGAAVQETRDIRDRLLNAGIEPERILLDLGFGFGTTFLEDSAIWDALPEMPRLLDWPMERFCIGVSRKRFVARTFGVEGNDPLDTKTADLHKMARNTGYKVFRTHALEVTRGAQVFWHRWCQGPRL